MLWWIGFCVSAYWIYIVLQRQVAVDKWNRREMELIYAKVKVED